MNRPTEEQETDLRMRLAKFEGRKNTEDTRTEMIAEVARWAKEHALAPQCHGSLSPPTLHRIVEDPVLRDGVVVKAAVYAVGCHCCDAEFLEEDLIFRTFLPVHAVME